ncbi:MAG: flagellar hook-basal body complex protein [Synergistales bacterium]|nr:flagellar hook-basal body complex protein [Synergistales bacterium]
MQRSLLSGVMGLKSYQTFLDTIGNNVANVETLGYKRHEVSFQEIFYQTTHGGHAPSGSRGGVNPMQIGMGSRVGAIETVYSQGNVEYTGNPNEIAIQGDGYYMLRDGDGRSLYTRAGNFTLDANNTMVQAGTGHTLQGYAMEEDSQNPGSYISTGQLSSISMPLGSKQPGEETSLVGFRCNLDSRLDMYLPLGVGEDVTLQDTVDGTTYEIDLLEGDTTDDFVTFDVSWTDADGNEQQSNLKAQFDGVNTETGLPELSGADFTFDSETGMLTIPDIDGAGEGHDIKMNLSDAMDYKSLSVSYENQATRSFLADFSLNADGDAATLTLWDHEGNVYAFPEEIPLNPDGSFGTNYEGTITTPEGDLTATISEDGRSVVFNSDQNLPHDEEGEVARITQRDTGVHVSQTQVYDSLGTAHTMEMRWEKIGADRWQWRASFPDEDGLNIEPPTGEVAFDGQGSITSENPIVSIGFGSGGAETTRVTFDFNGDNFDKEPIEGVTQYASPSTTKGYYQDGHGMGVMTSYQIGQDGRVSGIYDNGQTVPLYRIPLALANNPGGLSKAGENVYVEGPNTGIIELGNPSEGRAGKLMSMSLETSNVDIAQEFTNLIRGQRGYQANARIITTSDEVMEETVNLKR